MCGASGSAARRALPWLLLLALWASGCGGAGGATFKQPAAARTISGVPFFAQERYQCGPAALAGVMGYHGVKITPEEVAKAIYRPELHGSVTLDLVLYARGKKMSAKWYEGGPQDLTTRINAGLPLLVMVDRGIGPIRKLHYMVVVGYTPRAVIVNSGRHEHKAIAWDEFLGNWERTKFWSLLIGSPKG